MGLWGAVKKAAKRAAEAAEQVATAVVDSAEQVGAGVANAVEGAIEELSGSDDGNAWDFRGAASKIADGLDDAVLGGSETLLFGTINAAETAHSGTTEAVTEVFGKEAGAVYGNISGRMVDGARSVLVGTVEGAYGGIRNGVEAAGTILQGFGRLLKGDANGFKDIGSGFVKVSFQVPLDGILTAGGGFVSAAQTVLYLEPLGRKLTPDEVRELTRVFRNSVTYDRIVVKDGSAFAFAGERQFVHTYTIYMKNAASAEYLHTLVHETTHVWQFEHGGTDYMSESLWTQDHGKGYQWWRSVPQKAWSELKVEEQASLIEDAFVVSYFRSGSFTYDLGADGAISSPGATDITGYMDSAVEQLRAGKGAP